MLDWLKLILGEAYSEEIDRKVSEEIGRSFVARSDFNTLNTEKKTLADTVKARDKQLEDLSASTGDVEALKAQIATLQTENATAAKSHEAEIKRLKIDTAVELALTAARARNVKAAKALLDLDSAELDADGTVKGLADRIKELAEAPESSFMFETQKQKNNFEGFQPGESGDNGASGSKVPKDMTYEELCAYLAENPNAKL